MTNDSKSDVELAKITVGVPGVVGAEIPIRQGWFARLRGWRRAPFDVTRFKVPWARSIVWTALDDEGHIEATLSFLNMSDHAVTLNQLALGRLMASGLELPHMAPVVTLPPEPVGAFSQATIHLRAPINTAAIRILLRVVEKAPNPSSSARLELIVDGTLDISVRRDRHSVPFTVHSQPLMDFRNPSAKG